MASSLKEVANQSAIVVEYKGDDVHLRIPDIQACANVRKHLPKKQIEEGQEGVDPQQLTYDICIDSLEATVTKPNDMSRSDWEKIVILGLSSSSEDNELKVLMHHATSLCGVPLIALEQAVQSGGATDGDTGVVKSDLVSEVDEAAGDVPTE